MKNVDFLIQLYTSMVRIRTCEESLVDPIQRGEIKTPCHLCSGQEAVAAGVCAALRKTDAIFGGHRSHGHYLAKGGSMDELVAEIFAKSGGCSGGRGGSMHIISPENGVWGVVPIVAGTISLATGAAMAARIQKKDQVVVSFFGDGATGEGVLYESLNLASLLKLPIIYVCENNFYSTHMPLRECRRRDNIFQTGLPFGIRGIRLDGNDVRAVFKASQKAVTLCRSGNGPVFLECVTYRLRGHVGADDVVQGSHTDIRPPAEVERWRRRDPLSRFKKVLIKAGVSQVALKKIQKESSEEVARAHAFARRSPAPLSRDLGENIFGPVVAL
ncbi:MAG: thiamine pyrophosphate-dependent dehydrogenase E1 component subunit alpha [Elusimicrobia bacterium]|mgnify:CR=1 FL=1|nr:thiamine pyrophosphate-dependent dehydrogenase E1 component subunit alpha [Elusimicrobiota bacterium]